MLYAVPASLFAFSEHIASRFAYIPALALVLILVVALDEREVPVVRVAAALLIAWVAVSGPVVHYLDSIDYSRLAAMHEEILEGVRGPLSQTSIGDPFVLVNRRGPEPLVALSQDWRGRPKPLFVRGRAVGGMVYLQDLATILLAERDLAARPADCGGMTIEMGRRGPVRDRVCLQVASFRER